MTILFFVCLAFYLIIIWFGVINCSEGKNTTALLIISTLVFGIMITITTLLIVKYCYEYWVLLDNSIICKKLFSKKKEIKLAEIVKVDKKIVPALVLGAYKSESYIIHSKEDRISILLNDRKRYTELNSILVKYIDK